MTIRVLIADDHRIFRESLATILDSHGIQVIGQADDGEEAIVLAETLRPDVVLMDLEMPNMDGIMATRIIKQSMPTIKVLMLSAFSENEQILEAMKAGASGYVIKRVNKEGLVNIIKRCYQGEIQVSPYLANLVLQESQRAREAEPLEGGKASTLLSTQEQAILGLIVKGLSNDEIAETIHISRDTVKFHLKHIFEKLQVHNRTQAAVVAVERRLIPQ